MARRPDYRSAEARQNRWVYKDKRWCGKHGVRFQALIRDMYTCQRCGCIVVTGQANKSHPRFANVNHKVKHNGDSALAFDLDNLETVCQTCHSGAIQQQEAIGYSNAIGADGWPVDVQHPANRKRAS